MSPNDVTRPQCVHVNLHHVYSVVLGSNHWFPVSCKSSIKGAARQNTFNSMVPGKNDSFIKYDPSRTFPPICLKMSTYNLIVIDGNKSTGSGNHKWLRASGNKPSAWSAEALLNMLNNKQDEHQQCDMASPGHNVLIAIQQHTKYISQINVKWNSSDDQLQSSIVHTWLTVVELHSHLSTTVLTVISFHTVKSIIAATSLN